MGNANPTELQIGASGTLDGHRYTVRGRVVLSVEQDGETYYWNEYNLVDDHGGAVTLVFEIEENGPTWKLFKLFDPAKPMTAAEAATKRVGDTVQFGSRQAEVTLVNRSRVEFVAGQAPEGVEVGDTADYFNAEGGGRMIVVSWSGEEVEFYEGAPTGRRRIEAAFHLPKNSGGPTPSLLSNWLNTADNSAYTFAGTVLVAVLWFGVMVYDGTREYSPPPPPPPRESAPVFRLPDGAHGRLAGHAYAIMGHALIEVARVGRIFARHEYMLVEDNGAEALLINGLHGAKGEWHLLTPRQGAAGFSSYDAAGLRQGWPVEFAGHKMKVDQLFQARVHGLDGGARSSWPANLQYGFTAEGDGKVLLARWNDSLLQIYDGQLLTESDVLTGWGAK